MSLLIEKVGARAHTHSSGYQEVGIIYDSTFIHCPICTIHNYKDRKAKCGPNLNVQQRSEVDK